MVTVIEFGAFKVSEFTILQEKKKGKRFLFLFEELEACSLKGKRMRESNVTWQAKRGSVFHFFEKAEYSMLYVGTWNN